MVGIRVRRKLRSVGFGGSSFWPAAPPVCGSNTRTFCGLPSCKTVKSDSLQSGNRTALLVGDDDIHLHQARRGSEDRVGGRFLCDMEEVVACEARRQKLEEPWLCRSSRRGGCFCRRQPPPEGLCAAASCRPVGAGADWAVLVTGSFGPRQGINLVQVEDVDTHQVVSVGVEPGIQLGTTKANCSRPPGRSDCRYKRPSESRSTGYSPLRIPALRSLECR